MRPLKDPATEELTGRFSECEGSWPFGSSPGPHEATMIGTQVRLVDDEMWDLDA